MRDVEPASEDRSPTTRSDLVGGAQQAVLDGLNVLGRLLTGASWAIAGLLVLASAGSLLALVLGLLAWHDSIVGIVLVVLVAATGVVAPQVLRRRLVALVETATHPAEAAAQARDLIRRIRPDGEARQKVDQLRTAAAMRHRGRVRAALGMARATSGVLGLVEPDPERHRLLLPLRPERIASLSAWAWAAFWGPLAAFVLAVAALVTFALHAW
jgi:hypothetical protein